MSGIKNVIDKTGLKLDNVSNVIKSVPNNNGSKIIDTVNFNDFEYNDTEDTIYTTESDINDNIKDFKKDISNFEANIGKLNKEIDYLNDFNNCDGERFDFLRIDNNLSYDYDLQKFRTPEEYRDYRQMELQRESIYNEINEEQLIKDVEDYTRRYNEALSSYTNGEVSSYDEFMELLSTKREDLFTNQAYLHQAKKRVEEATFDNYCLDNNFKDNFDFAVDYSAKIKSDNSDEYNTIVSLICNMIEVADWHDAETYYREHIARHGESLSAFDLLECVCEQKYNITPEELRKLSKEDAEKLVNNLTGDGLYWALETYDIYKYLNNKQLAMYKTVFEKTGDAGDYYEAIEEEINSLQGLEDAMGFIEDLLKSSGYELDDVRFVVNEGGELSIYTKNANGEFEENYDLKTKFFTTVDSFFNGVGDGTLGFFEGFTNIFNSSDNRTRLDFKKVYVAAFLEENAILKGSYDVGSGIGNMLPSIALSALAGYAGVPAAIQENIGYGFLGLSTYGNEYHNYRAQGISEGQARIGGILKGSIEYLTGKLFGAIPGLNNEANVNIFKTVGDSVVGFEKWYRVVGDVVKNMGHEGFEEFIQTYFEAGVDAFATGRETAITDTSKEALYSFLMGALTSGIMTNSQVGVQFTFGGINYAMTQKQLKDFFLKNRGDDIQSDLSSYQTNTGSVREDVSSNISSVEEVNLTVDTNSFDKFQRISDSVKEDIIKYQPEENSFFSTAGDFGVTSNTTSDVVSRVDMDSIISNVDSRVSRWESDHSISMDSLIKDVQNKVPDSKGTAKECYYVTVDGVRYALLKYDADTKQLRDSFIRMNATYSMVEEGMHTPCVVDYAIVDGVMYELQENVEGIQLFGKNNDQKSLQILDQCSSEQLISFMKDIAIYGVNGGSMDFSGDNIYITEDGNFSIIDLTIIDNNPNGTVNYYDVLNSLPNRLSMLFLDSTRVESIDFDTLSNIGKKWIEASYQYLQLQGLSDSDIRSYLEGINTNSFGINVDTKSKIINDIVSKDVEISFDVGEHFVYDDAVNWDDDVEVDNSNQKLIDSYNMRLKQLRDTYNSLNYMLRQNGYLEESDRIRFEMYGRKIRELQDKISNITRVQNDNSVSLVSESSNKNIVMRTTYNYFQSLLNYGQKTYGIDQRCISSLYKYKYKDKVYSFREWERFCDKMIMKGKPIPYVDEQIVTDEYCRLENKLMTQYKLNEESASIILTAINNDAGACSYASVCNEILASFVGKEREFERKFGYPLYNKYGLNDVELMLDLYMFANMKENGGEYFKRKFLSRKKVAIVSDAYSSSKIDPMGRTMLDGEKQNRLSDINGRKVDIVADFLKSKGISYSGGVLHRGYLGENIVDCRRNMNSLLKDIRSRIESGSQFSISIYRNDNSTVRMLSMNPNLYRDVSSNNFKMGHSVYITGVGDNGFMVSSWGKKYKIPFKDLMDANFVINESIINQ